MIITATRADSIVPGDMIDMKTVLGFFDEVAAVRYIDNNGKGSDLVVISTKGTAISNTRTYRAARMVDVATR